MPDKCVHSIQERTKGAPANRWNDRNAEVSPSIVICEHDHLFPIYFAMPEFPLHLAPLPRNVRATMRAILALEDGRYFSGESFGATGSTVGEVCFNTSMTGYQEVLTD